MEQKNGAAATLGANEEFCEEEKKIIARLRQKNRLRLMFEQK